MYETDSVLLRIKAPQGRYNKELQIRVIHTVSSSRLRMPHTHNSQPQLLTNPPQSYRSLKQLHTSVHLHLFLINPFNLIHTSCQILQTSVINTPKGFEDASSQLCSYRCDGHDELQFNGYGKEGLKFYRFSGFLAGEVVEVCS
jgi:hypothetical protein